MPVNGQYTDSESVFKTQSKDTNWKAIGDVAAIVAFRLAQKVAEK